MTTAPPLAAPIARRAVAEALGTALLLAMIVGSGIMAERLSVGNVAITLLANSIATGAGLAVLILVFGPISGAHLNPAVTLADQSPICNKSDTCCWDSVRVLTSLRGAI